MGTSVSVWGVMAEPQDGRPDQPGDAGTTNPRKKHNLQDALREMNEDLRRHSALEDLGPLFGPEAQGGRRFSGSS